MINLSKKQFEEYKSKNVVFPISIEFSADQITPVSIFYNLKGKNRFLLESASIGENSGRYSFLGSDPIKSIKSMGNNITTSYANGEVTFHDGKVLEHLKKSLDVKFEDTGLEFPFTGGAIGYAGYDIIRQFERIPDKNPSEINLPEAYLLFYKMFVCYDHFKRTLNVVYNVYPEDTDIYEEIIDKINRFYYELTNITKIYGLPKAEENKDFKSNFTEEEFTKIVEKAKEYIVKGDIFQVVLSQRFSLETNADPFDVYRRLRSKNPSPYLFYIDYEDFQLVGASPESLVSLHGRKVVTNPIAGTRPRGKNREEDLALKNDLLSDEKEIAEHMMLVDLGRNDIGRVSKFKTVNLDRFMEVDNYSHVMHIVSKVSGELRDGLTCFDALAACFPAGTVSGAPKIRAMEIIDELENIRREAYAGAVGYFGYNGDMDVCIAIRTFVFKNGKAYIQAGAGIVYDSKPEMEYKETVNKAMALREVI